MLGTRTCTKCGRRNPGGARYCNSCGEPLQVLRPRRGCLAARSMMTTLALLLGAVVLYLLSTGGLGLSLDNLWPLTAPDESDTSATATPPAANAARPVNSGPRIVSYTVTATAGAAPGSVEVDYVDAGARPAHAQVTLPWQQEAQLAPGAVARLVAEGEAGQGFIARIYVAGELRAEAEAEPVAAAPGATPRWRAQVEAPLAP